MKLREMALVYRANNALLGLRLRELPAGSAEARVTGTQWKAVPLVRES